MKKLFSSIIALMIFMGMSIPAFATTATDSISNEDLTQSESSVTP